MFECCSSIRDAITSLNILPLNKTLVQQAKSNLDSAPVTLMPTFMDRSSVYASNFYFPCFIKRQSGWIAYKEWRNSTLNKLAFEIASYAVDPSNDKHVLHPMYSPLKSALDKLAMDEMCEYDTGIIRVIIDYVHWKAGRWNRDYHEKMIEELIDFFDYESDDKMVRFKQEVVDAVNIPSHFEIDPADYNVGGLYRFIIHCCCLNKADEMWIGLQRKSRYKWQYSYPRNTPESVVFYGGRESSNRLGTKNGAVWKDEECISDELPSWRAGDWISLVLGIEGSTMMIYFYRNGESMMQFDWEYSSKESSDPYLLYVLVDADDDSWYIEEAATLKGLKIHANTLHY